MKKSVDHFHGRVARSSDRFQFVWWGWEWNWGLRHFEGGIAKVYRWSFGIGPVEIRRWEDA